MLSDEEKQKLLTFLEDDRYNKDVTSSLIPVQKTKALIKTDKDCVLAGLEESVFLFEHVGCSARKLKEDGAEIKKNESVLEVEGENRKIFSVERTSLNVLGRMSGVATLSRETKEIAGSGTTVALTRKTVPGFNTFDKKAAEIGGVWPHRKNLEEAVLVKENHLKFVSIKEAVSEGRKTGKSVEVEVETSEEVKEALSAGPDMIMLDNFSLERAKEAIQEIRSKNPEIKIELSGGINLANLSKYAELNPDYISLGFLTKTAKTIDFSLGVL